MCLLTKPNSRKIATEDIHLYKAVLIHKSHPDKWRGVFYFEKEYPFDEVIKLRGDDEKNMIRKNPIYSEPDILCIGKNFLHSTNEKTIAENIARTNNSIELPVNVSFMQTKLMVFNCVVCKCTIPKGSVYYVDDYDEYNYASDKLIVHKPKNI